MENRSVLFNSAAARLNQALKKWVGVMALLSMSCPGFAQNTPLCFEELEDGANLPIVEVKVNVHFIQDASGLTFHPATPGQPSLTDGNLAAAQMVSKANEYYANMLESPTSLKNFLGDSRIRFVLYSELENEQDLYNGIWYWEEEPAGFPYGSQVLNIIVEKNNSSADARACTEYPLCNYLRLFNWYEKVVANGQENLHWDYAKFAMHGLGRITGLAYAFECCNECASEDIDPRLECNQAGLPCDPQCGGDAGGCAPYSSESHNLMSFNNSNRALTPCQWRKYYTALYYGRPGYAQPSAACGPFTNTPITIPSGTWEEWDSPVVVQGNVTLQAGATLSISCVTFMAPGTNIIVRRGAKLIIQNGQVRRLCEEQAWGGIWIEGHAGKEQPEPDPFTPASSYPDTDIAGAAILLNARVIGGGHTLITRSFTSPDDAAYFGGLVYAENSGFWDNKRAAEFMPYNRSNKSRFIDCHFEESGQEVDGSMGVSIWNCRGIQFIDNSFRELDFFGLGGLDFGAEILSGNLFEGNGRAVEIFNTFPLFAHRITIGLPGNSYRNIFSDNTFSILAESTGALDGLFIEDNDFFDNRIHNEGGNAEVYIDGEALYRIRENGFDLNGDTWFGVHCINTLSAFNEINCNDFNEVSFAPILIQGSNSELNIQYNTFLLSGRLGDIAIRSFSNSVGSIARQQGAPGNPAANCFSSPTKAFSFLGNTTPFTYFIPKPEFGPRPCFLPAPPSQFSMVLVNDTEENDCFKGEAGPQPPFTLPALSAARLAVANTYDKWLANPSEPTAEAAYRRAMRDKEAILRWLLRQHIDSKQFAQAQAILAGESGYRARQWEVSLKLLAEDYAGATALWQALPAATEDEQYFSEIAAINIQRLQGGSNFVLSGQQENQLYLIAQSGSPYRSYARSLLFLFKGVRFSPEPVDFGEAEQSLAPTPVQEQEAPRFRAYPNPASSTLQLRYPELEGPASLWLIPVAGGPPQQYALPRGSATELDIRQLPAGAYLLEFHQGGAAIHREKVVLIP